MLKPVLLHLILIHLSPYLSIFKVILKRLEKMIIMSDHAHPNKQLYSEKQAMNVSRPESNGRVGCNNLLDNIFFSFFLDHFSGGCFKQHWLISGKFLVQSYYAIVSPIMFISGTTQPTTHCQHHHSTLTNVLPHACILHHPPTYPFQAPKFITNPLHMPYHCALFLGSLLLIEIISLRSSSNQMDSSQIWLYWLNYWCK